MYCGPKKKGCLCLLSRKHRVHRLSSTEYYNMSGTVNHQKVLQGRKQSLYIERIETNIPSPKTAFIQRYMPYLTYILQHMDVLFNFYNFETAKPKWLNYIGSQKVIQESINILLNSGKKYDKSRRRKKRRKVRWPAEHTHPIPQSERYILFFFLA